MPFALHKDNLGLLIMVIESSKEPFKFVKPSMLISLALLTMVNSISMDFKLTKSSKSSSDGLLMIER